MNQKPSIGRIVHYINLGDKDGKYPPEIQAALITGVYKTGPETSRGTPPQEPGNNDSIEQNVVPANNLGDVADSYLVDLKVEYRAGQFHMSCVPFSPEPARGHWSWPPKV